MGGDHSRNGYACENNAVDHNTGDTWGRRGRCGEDGDDVGTMGTTWAETTAVMVMLVKITQLTITIPFMFYALYFVCLFVCIYSEYKMMTIEMKNCVLFPNGL